MGKTMVAVLFGFGMVVAGASAAFALQAGGVEIGDLETGLSQISPEQSISQ